MEYIYHCKKNGLDYPYRTDIEFAAPQDAYAWRRGVREYGDNYHAELVWKNRAGEVVFKGTEAEYKDKVHEYCVEAQTKFHAGDVPSERGQSDPATVQARKDLAALKSAGISNLTPEMLAMLAEAIKKAEADKSAAEPVVEIVEQRRKRG